MSLHVVLGFDGPSVEAEPKALYVGSDGAKARAALEDDSECYRYLIIRNPSGVRKYNAEKVAKRQAELDKKAKAEAEAEAKRLAAEKAKAEAAKQSPPKK